MQSKFSVTTLATIHGFLVIGLLLFCGFAFWKNPSFSASTEANNFTIYLVPLVAAIGYFTSKFIFQKRIRNIKQNDSMQTKIELYQTAHILKYALLEAPAILAIGAYYMQGNAMFLVVSLCLIAYLISQRPSVKKFYSDLQMHVNENKPDKNII